MFSVRVLDRVLIYSPGRGVAALVNRAAERMLREGGTGVGAALERLAAALSTQDSEDPVARSACGEACLDPLLLGIIPTRACNLACSYCDFGAARASRSSMPLETARQAVCGYRQILRAAGRCGGEYHFFGGEPLYAPAVVESVVDLATALDGAEGGRSRFEITTNGVCSPERAEWLAERFDTVVLSLDGPPRFHDRSRVHRSGGGSSASVMRTARILSQGPTELIIRCCVTSEMADSLAGTAEWLVGEFRPAMVCFETLTSTPESRECGLRPPDPWTFARGFDEAAGLLERHGVPAVLSTADLGESRRTCCPVGRDALIVSPDGSVGACYLRREDWERAGLDLTLGKVGPGGFELCPRALERARACGVDGKRRCLRCLCRWHCAGGCHVRHPGGVATDEFDDACLQTRLVTVAGLLRRLGEDDVRTRWMASREALEVTARQSHDRWEEDGR